MIAPVHRKEMVRKIRILKGTVFITAEFLHKKENEAMTGVSFSSGSLIS